MEINNLIIIPHTEKYEGITNQRPSYCYLHGELERIVGYDCFGFKSDEDGYFEDEEIPEGIYPCTYEGMNCTFLVWARKRTGGRAGLVVLNTDIDARIYALTAYNDKLQTI